MLTNRQKTILLNIIASPFFLAIPVSILIIIFLPNPSSKYKIELVSKEVANKPNSRMKFYDLNGDGRDERIIAFHNLVKGEAAIKVMTNDGVNYDAWNFHGYFQKSSDDIFCGNLNNDEFKELYVFYHKDDSVFLGVIQPFPNKETLIQKKFITTVLKRNGKIDFGINLFREADLNGDGSKELVFIVNAGYSRQPRAVFAYDMLNDTITTSPSFGIFMSRLTITDLDNDSIPEIYCGSSTPANIPDSMDIDYDDYHSWFVGYDNKLKLLFKPIKNDDYPSDVNICEFVSDNGKNYIAAAFVDKGKKALTIKFFYSGDKVFSSKEFVDINYSRSGFKIIMHSIVLYGKNYVLMGIRDNKFVLINEKLEIVSRGALPFVTHLKAVADIDKDGKDEFIFLSHENIMVIYGGNLGNPTIIETGILPFSMNTKEVGLKHNGSNQGEVFIRTDNFLYLYSYTPNRLYYLKYPIWILLYAFVVFVLWLTQRMQKIQMKRKQRIEETINSLQMKTIKSQMDPHFMFNVLNGLANNVAMGNSKQAYDQILRFSQLLRSLMKRTDKIDIGLTEELEFVNSYLELEKFRFKDDFEFEIVVEESIDKTIRLPRMLIQLLVENSIKHGLRNKEGLKKLSIEISSKNNNIVIIVEDNGVGRKEAMQKTRDTGKGMKLINDMIRLNRKLGGNEITLAYTDLYDKTGKASGTRVEVVLERGS